MARDQGVYKDVVSLGHGGMEHDMGAMRASPTAAQAPAAAPDPHAGHVMPAPTPPPPDPHAGHVMPQSAAPDPHAGHDMSATSGAMQVHPPSEQGNPLVDMQTMSPSSKLDDPGIGLRDNGRRVLTYADRTSVFDDPDGREPRSANTRLTCRRAAVGAIESRPTRWDGGRITATCSSTWRLGCSGKYAWTKGGSHDAARGCCRGCQRSRLVTCNRVRASAGPGGRASARATATGAHTNSARG